MTHRLVAHIGRPAGLCAISPSEFWRPGRPAPARLPDHLDRAARNARDRIERTIAYELPTASML
jgi:hypothetical protein